MMAQERTVLYEDGAIRYVLEEKPVKNLNLRIHKDCKVYVSASPDVPVEKVDDFVASKGRYIRSAQGKFLDMLPGPGSTSAERLSTCWVEASA